MRTIPQTEKKMMTAEPKTQIKIQKPTQGHVFPSSWKGGGEKRMKGTEKKKNADKGQFGPLPSDTLFSMRKANGRMIAIEDRVVFA